MARGVGGMGWGLGLGLELVGRGGVGWHRTGWGGVAYRGMGCDQIECNGMWWAVADRANVSSGGMGWWASLQKGHRSVPTEQACSARSAGSLPERATALTAHGTKKLHEVCLIKQLTNNQAIKV